jgi:hypothetical protein
VTANNRGGVGCLDQNIVECDIFNGRFRATGERGRKNAFGPNIGKNYSGEALKPDPVFDIDPDRVSL